MSNPSDIRLITLREACERRGIATSSYYRNPTLLPAPIRDGGARNTRLMFFEHEVAQHILRLAETNRVEIKIPAAAGGAGGAHA